MLWWSGLFCSAETPEMPTQNIHYSPENDGSWRIHLFASSSVTLFCILQPHTLYLHKNCYILHGDDGSMNYGGYDPPWWRLDMGGAVTLDGPGCPDPGGCHLFLCRQVELSPSGDWDEGGLQPVSMKTTPKQQAWVRDVYSQVPTALWCFARIVGFTTGYYEIDVNNRRLYSSIHYKVLVLLIFSFVRL